MVNGDIACHCLPDQLKELVHFRLEIKMKKLDKEIEKVGGNYSILSPPSQMCTNPTEQ